MLISFTINGGSYQAEKGMTWEQWVNSDYNVNQEYYLDDTLICKPRLLQVAGVIKTDMIKDNYAYRLVDISGATN